MTYPCYPDEVHWEDVLPSYRLYALDGADRIAGAEWIDAADDDQARSIARERSERFELWDRNRLIERSPEKEA